MITEYTPLLKNKKFIYIWTSQIFSQLSINMMNFVLLIYLYEKTGSALSTALLWIAYALPAIIFGPLASGVIDLVDKRKVLVITNLLQALTIFLYALGSHSSIFLLYQVVFLYSLFNQFYVPAEAATLPIVLKKDQLPQGNGLFFITQNGALVLGFGAAGILKSFLGVEYSLFICALFLFIAFISTTFLPSFKSETIIPKKFEEIFLGFFKHIFEGYEYIRHERKVLTPVLLLLGFQVALQLCTVQFPALAEDILSIPLNAAGVYILVPAGMGTLLSSFIIPKILKKDVRKKTVIDMSFLMVGFSLITITFIAPLFHPLVKLLLTFAALVVVGFAYVGVLVPSQTFLQESTPAELRGRVFGNFWFLVTVASVVPVIFSGSIVEVLGIHSLMTLLALFAFGVYFVSKRYGSSFIAG